MMRGAEPQRRADSSPEETATRLVAELTGRLRQNEDAETALDVYKTSNWIIGQLEDVKDAALDLAEKDLEQRGLDSLNTPTGSAGWTEPQTRRLDENAWAQAVARNPRLREIQREFEVSRAALERAQEPFKELPESRFYIR
ncbi:MAG: hypothetical protein ACOC7N_01295 [Chloroflexota bacterium]